MHFALDQPSSDYLHAVYWHLNGEKEVVHHVQMELLSSALTFPLSDRHQ